MSVCEEKEAIVRMKSGSSAKLKTLRGEVQAGRDAEREIAFHPAKENDLRATPQKNAVTSGFGVGLLGGSLPCALPGDERGNAALVNDQTINREINLNSGKVVKVLLYLGF